MIIRSYFFAAWFLLLSVSAFADPLTKEKYADIRRLMEINGSSNIAVQFASANSQGMYHALKNARPDIPARTVEIINRELLVFFTEKMNAPGGLLEKLVPIYDKHFTHTEIKELLTFYKSPVGKKSIAVLPQVVAEGSVIGQNWAQSLRPEISKRVDVVLDKEGIIPLRK